MGLKSAKAATALKAWPSSIKTLLKLSQLAQARQRFELDVAEAIRVVSRLAKSRLNDAASLDIDRCRAGELDGVA
jgi:hypothetical protein